MKKADLPNEPLLVGYARVSTEDQNLNLQLDALRKAGVTDDHIHVEKISGASKRRPSLELAIKDLRPGDTFLVWRLDRLTRNMQDLYTRLDQIYEQGATFRSIQESFDFNTVTGKFVLGILGLVAQLERQLIAQRTAAGMAAAKERGLRMGRTPSMTEDKIAKAGAMLKHQRSVKTVAEVFDVAPSTIYAHYTVRRTKDGKQIATRKRKPR